MKQNAFWNFRQQWAMEASGKRKLFRDRRPSKTIPASTGFLWTATVDTECFNRATGLAFAWFWLLLFIVNWQVWQKFSTAYCKDWTKFYRQIRAEPSINGVFQVINPYLRKMIWGKPPSLTPLPANFTLAGIHFCRQPAAGHVLTFVFHRQWESLAEKSDRFV